MEWTHNGKTRKEWAALIRKQRRSLDITQQELAVIVGVSTACIAHTETNRMFPNMELFEKILLALKISEDV